jgi:membrane associated rhomboid family serine protease
VNETELEKKESNWSFLFPLLFIIFLWLIKGYEIYFQQSLGHFGNLPRDIKGLRGIVFMPFLHGDISHLANNSVSLFVLGTGLFYFYKEVAIRIFIGTWLMSGLWIWLAARTSYHIGASGIIYGLASFIFFSGIFRKYYKMMALSLLVVFLYGGMVWGILPIANEGISWEGHLFGALAGFMLAYHYRHIGPQRKIYDWENEEDENLDLEIDDFSENQNENVKNEMKINYIYRDKKENE